MKKLIILLLVMCLAVSFPAYAKTKTEYITVTKKVYLGKFKITHYCPCSRCCGVGGGRITASGTRPTAGRTVGVNPRLIPYGTKLKIGKVKGYVAEDTGGGIGWKHLDVFCSSHQEALNKGVLYKDVWSYTETRKKVKVKIYKMQKLKLRPKGGTL